MDRREVLKYTALLTGATLGGPLITAILSGCSPEKIAEQAGPGLHVLNDKQFALLTDLVDTILPATDSPSGSDMGVPKMIDSMVGLTFVKEDKDKFAKGFRALAEYIHTKTGGYRKLLQDKKLELLITINESDGVELKEVRDAFRSVKKQAIAYYLSSERISKEFLNFLPVPGEYEACIQLSDVGGKAWAI